MRLLIFVCFLTTSQVIGQQVYILDNENTISIFNPFGELSSTIQIPDSIGIADIAVSPSGDIYGINNMHIIQIDSLTGNVTNVEDLPELPSLGFWNSLVSDNDYNLYTVDNFENGLYKYSILQDTISKIFDLGYSSSGDLTIFKGNLILSTFDFTDNKRKLISYNLISGNVEILFCTPATFSIFGLANVFNECDDNKILAGVDDEGIYEVNFINGVFSPSDIDYDISKIYGMATDVEHLASNCNEELTNLNCDPIINQTLNFQNQNIRLFPNPVSDYLNVESSLSINKIEIYNMLGILKVTQEVDVERIDLTKLTAGIYVVIMKTESGIFKQTIVKGKMQY